MDTSSHAGNGAAAAPAEQQGTGPQQDAGMLAAADDGGDSSPAAGVGHGAGAFDPVKCLPRAQRMALGALCKRLIDAGRLEWLQQRCATAELVYYIQPEVSGENRLLLGRVLPSCPDPDRSHDGAINEATQ